MGKGRCCDEGVREMGCDDGAAEMGTEVVGRWWVSDAMRTAWETHVIVNFVCSGENSGVQAFEGMN